MKLDTQPLSSRIAAVDWDAAEDALLRDGFLLASRFLDRAECAALRSLYDGDDIFRSRVVMERHNFGRGEYKYFAYPLPDMIRELREALYEKLAPIANRWNERLNIKTRYPAHQQQFLDLCVDAEQPRPTALILRYRAGDYNCMHQDLYGELAFPFQVTFFLSGLDEYDGGEFVLTEQRPRAQTRPVVLRPNLGDFVIIPNRYRPVEGSRGFYRTTFRHGVSEVRKGERFTLGVIFHDAH
jgi:hypothetical protein